MLGKKWIFIFCAFWASAAAYSACALPYVYFDLGANTLIDTNHDTFKQVKYMPGARDYLQSLKAKGYHLGLLVNVPESWGKTQEEKLKTTQLFISQSWAESLPFDWSVFDLGVAFPPTEAERKPAPYLFNQAVAQAFVAACDSVYQTTLPKEVPAANQAGMTGIIVGAGSYDGSYFYPEARLKVRDFSIVRPVNSNSKR